MNSIDAAEGTAKCILRQLHQVFAEGTLDDTEYIRNVKAVLEGTEMFLRENQGVSDGFQIVKASLQEFAKNLWLKNLKKAEDAPATADSESDEYHEYYYDHIYTHGVYPR
jgi:hypothetical protein